MYKHTLVVLSLVCFSVVVLPAIAAPEKKSSLQKAEKTQKSRKARLNKKCKKLVGNINDRFFEKRGWTLADENCVEDLLDADERSFRNLTDYNHARAFAACRYFSLPTASKNCERLALRLPQAIDVPDHLQKKGFKKADARKQFAICQQSDAGDRGKAACDLQMNCAPPFTSERRDNCRKTRQAVVSGFGADFARKAKHANSSKDLN